MPAPVTICSICNQSVLKARTYHVGGGKRACRTHEGVLEIKASLDVKAKEHREWELEKAKRHEAELKERMTQLEPGYWLKPRCWCCKNTGVTEQQFYINLLIYSEKEKLKGQYPTIFSPEYASMVRRAQGLKEGEVLYVISVYPITKEHPVIKKLDYNGRQAAQLGLIVALCPKCAKNNGVEKPITVDFSLYKAVLLYDLVSPLFKAAAVKLLAVEAQSN